MYFQYPITHIKKRRKAGQWVRYEKEQGGFKSQEEQVQVPGRHVSPRLPGRQRVGRGRFLVEEGDQRCQRVPLSWGGDDPHRGSLALV